MLTIKFDQFCLSRKFYRYLITGTLAIASILGGVVPQGSRQSLSLTFSNSAFAQNISDEDIEKFAQAVLDMETRRQRAYSDIQKIMGAPPPTITCSDRSSFKNLPEDAKEIAEQFCKDSKNIVESRGLSVSKFNTITNQVQSNPNLQKRIQNSMIQIQQNR
jgi:hypothetical protein